MNNISLLHCDEYNYKQVKEVIDQTFINLGGIQKFVKPGMKVLLKLNLLMKKRPEEVTTTHPVFVEALTQAVQEAGGIVTIADSPGGLYTQKALKGVYSVCGIEEVAKKTGAILNYDVTYKEVSFPEGKITKSFAIITPVLESDLIINVPKLKTHGMTLFTGAVKNLFGTIPGTYKAEYHFRMQNKKDFCNALIDLCEFIKPSLSFMDGIVGMEGSGPSGGNPREIGVVIASTSPYLVDLVATTIISIKPSEVYTIVNSIERGLCPSNIAEINITGDDINRFIIKDYKLPVGRSLSFLEGLPQFMQNSINSWISPKPVFIHEECIGCKDCEVNCPPKAITMKEKKPYVNLNECIKCFCCQELCPKKAIQIKRPWWIEKFLK
ncbi:MAG: hypothetical protein PWP27_1863 [Clostridiales bacterium]|jgi:uncharacterized protein (DUF362 family)/Pyruvate/2-oxoacid:ferredoxin oxidoreductase delta subunit|nr:hypothetical protein [Clostridiales bacterium]MDK2934053.1 hypothetical protein [Clostridiales bacterium]